MRRNENTSAICKSILTLAVTMALSASTGALAAGEHSGGHGGGHGAGGHGSSSKMMPNAGHGGGHSKAAGEPGKASEATRTLNIDMTDNRYSNEKITVKAGETIRFVIRNKGELVHEFNIGTPGMHKVHQKEMMMMVDHGVLEADKINHDKMKMDMGGGKTMEHNDPNSALLEPGKSAEIVWKFSKTGTFEFACNVPGHYDAGMVGELTVK
tara:strand:- start:8080 stop:8712 length:633 start_codon:yes stop_codon:yes gene_type:complete